MSAIAQIVFDDSRMGSDDVALGPVDPKREDSYWERAFRRERYYRPQFDFEDYAPAYCVGYVGYAQYGGDYADAENSLRANWERIKGDSRLSLSEALAAMRAAWDRMDGRKVCESAKKVIHIRLLRQRLRRPAFKLIASGLR